MKEPDQLRAELSRLNQIQNLDADGVLVRMITVIALEWALGLSPVSPADRLYEVTEELAYDGAMDLGGEKNGEGD